MLQSLGRESARNLKLALPSIGTESCMKAETSFGIGTENRLKVDLSFVSDFRGFVEKFA